MMHANDTIEPVAALHILMVSPHGRAQPKSTFPFLSGFAPLSHLGPPHLTMPRLSLSKMQSLNLLSVIRFVAAAASTEAVIKSPLLQPQSQLLSNEANPAGSIRFGELFLTYA